MSNTYVQYSYTDIPGKSFKAGPFPEEAEELAYMAMVYKMLQPNAADVTLVKQR